SHESDNRVPKNLENDRYKIGERYHVVPPLYTRTFLPPKLDWVFTDDPNASKSVDNVFNVESSTNKPSKDMSKTHRPDAPIVEDWISDSEDETKIDKSVDNVFNVESSTNKPSKDMSKTHRPDAPIVEDWISDSEDETKIESMPKQREHSFVTSTEHMKSSREPGNPQQALRDKGVIDSGFPRHMTGNISFLLEFEEINGGYVAFGGNPKGGKIS
nr:hypothetical protein [Tanacetum cinerariifolium]